MYDHIVDHEVRGAYQLPVQGNVLSLGAITPHRFLVHYVDAIERQSIRNCQVFGPLLQKLASEGPMPLQTRRLLMQGGRQPNYLCTLIDDTRPP